MWTYRDYWRRLFVVIGIAVAGHFASDWARDSAIGARVESAVYRLGRFVAARQDQDLDELVRVVDLARLAPSRYASVAMPDRQAVVDTAGVTSRTRLKEILETLKSGPPLAVGIDIDFGRRTLPHPEDKDFFTYCKASTPLVPIYLGVDVGVEKGRAHWLGWEQFAPLAASVRERSDRTILHTLSYSFAGRDTIDVLPSLAYAVARHAPDHAAPWVKTFGERALPRRRGRLITVEEMVIDTSHIDDLLRQSQELSTSDPQFLRDIAPAAFRGRIVFLGQLGPSGGATAINDTFRIDGRTYPGILKHACAAYTIAASRAYMVKKSVATWTDFAVPAFAIVLLTWAHVSGYLRDRHARIVTAATMWLCLAVAVATISVLAIWFIFWFDAPFLILSLVVSDRLSKLFEKE